MQYLNKVTVAGITTKGKGYSTESRSCRFGSAVVGGSPMAPEGPEGAGSHNFKMQSKMRCLHAIGHAGQTCILPQMEQGKASGVS